MARSAGGVGEREKSESGDDAGETERCRSGDGDLEGMADAEAEGVWGWPEGNWEARVDAGVATLGVSRERSGEEAKELGRGNFARDRRGEERDGGFLGGELMGSTGG